MSRSGERERLQQNGREKFAGRWHQTLPAARSWGTRLQGQTDGQTPGLQPPRDTHGLSTSI